MLLRVVSKHKKKAAIEKMLGTLWDKYDMEKLMMKYTRYLMIFGPDIAAEVMREPIRLKLSEIENDK
jgi:hypothetical protein